MKCIVCKRSCEEVELYEGILEDGMVMVCNLCAENEGIPVIRKPTNEQLSRADKRYSVRERMERLSGMGQTTDISPDQTIVQGNLARLRVPEKRQVNEEVVENYDWNLKIERRRRKMTLSQLAVQSGIDYNTLQLIEKGQLPPNFKEIFLKLESFLGIRLLKYHEPLKVVRTSEDEEKIIREVKKKMGLRVEDYGEEPGGSFMEESEEIVQDDEEFVREKAKKVEKIKRGEFDFSRRGDLTNVTLNDLVEMKKAREKRETRLLRREKESELFGEDVDFDGDEV